MINNPPLIVAAIIGRREWDLMQVCRPRLFKGYFIDRINLSFCSSSLRAQAPIGSWSNFHIPKFSLL
jgi:hypothetical protein